MPAAAVLGLIAGYLQPVLAKDMPLILAMTVLGLFLGLSPGWYFQGRGEARLYAALEIGALLAFSRWCCSCPSGRATRRWCCPSRR